MKKILLTIFLLINVLVIFAQQSRYVALKPGEVLPDLKITTLNGDSVRNERFSDYKGKLIILDFWNTQCGSCIAAMPKMYQLQQQFKDKIKIFLVTYEGKDKVEKLWPILKKTKVKSDELVEAGTHLPIIINDTTLTKLFPHTGNPSHVWIDGNGVYWATAWEQTTTPQNITDFINGKKIRWALDAQTSNFDAGDPISWLNINNGKFRPNLQSYSLMVKRINYGNGELSNQTIIDSITKKTVGLISINRSILDLYKAIFALKYPEYGDYYSGYGLLKPVVLNIRNKRKFIAPDSDDPNYYFWLDSNAYCYAIRVPSNQSSNLFAIAQKDLDYSFNLHSEIRNIKAKSLTLKSHGNIDLIYKKSNYKAVHFSNTSLGASGIPIYHVVDLAELCSIIRDVSTTPKQPFVEVHQGIVDRRQDGHLNIEIPWDGEPGHLSTKTLMTTLKKYNLYLVEGTKPEPILIINETGGN